MVLKFDMDLINGLYDTFSLVRFGVQLMFRMLALRPSSTIITKLQKLSSHRVRRWEVSNESGLADLKQENKAGGRS